MGSRIKRRLRPLIVGLAVVLVPLTVLPAAGARMDAGARSDASNVTLRFWVMNNGPEPVRDTERILAPFERQTGIDVRVELVGWDVQYQRITNAALSGEAPDVTQAGTTQVPFFAMLQGFENLAGRVGQIGGARAYAPGVWATSQVAGSRGVWAVPWFTEARTIYYRKDVFRRAGINPRTAFRDWAAFRRTLIRLKRVRSVNGRPIAPFGQPGKTAWDLVHHVMPFVWGAGGSELSRNRRQSGITSPQAVRGVKFFADLIPAGVFLTSSLERNAPQVEEQFKGGRIATWIGGPWVLASARRTDDEAWVPEARRNIGVAQMPVGPTGKFYTFVGGSNLMMFKRSRHKAEAWQLMRFLSREDTQLAYARLLGMFPARLAPQRRQGRLNANQAAFYRAITHGRTYAPIPQWGPIENVYKTRFGNILDMAAGQGRRPYNRGSLVAELQAAAREANTLLAQGG
jgi:multiple sugar transport system substrate-binding protein